MERTIPFAPPTLHDLRVRLQAVVAPRGANKRRPPIDDGTINHVIVLLTALLEPYPGALPTDIYPIRERVEEVRRRMVPLPEAIRTWDHEDMAPLCDHLLLTLEKVQYQADLAVHASRATPAAPTLPTVDLLMATAIRAAAVALAWRAENDQPVMIRALRVANACTAPNTKLAALMRYALEFTPSQINWLDFPEVVRFAVIRLVRGAVQSPESYVAQIAQDRTAAEVFFLDLRDLAEHIEDQPEASRALLLANTKDTQAWLLQRYPDLPA